MLMKHEATLSGKRKPVNLSIDTGIVAAARASGLNLSQISESAIRAATRDVHRQRWIEDNRAALQSSNAWVEDNDLPYASLRVR